MSDKVELEYMLMTERAFKARDEARAKTERLKAELWQIREDLAHLVQQIDAALEPRP